MASSAGTGGTPGGLKRMNTTVGLQVRAAEANRLKQEKQGKVTIWKRWGPYLSERQWATIREDYSKDGNCWDYFPHDHARSRAYRWGEDGLLGICDEQCRLCFSVALWNEKDPILKERLFGLTGPEGNHGEDCKECYYYLDSTPTHSYMKALYKYPQAEYPYGNLVNENQRRGVDQPEYELEDTGVFDDSAYWDVIAEYAKGSPDDILIRLTVANRGKEKAKLHLLPTLWYRNTWVWENTPTQKPILQPASESHVVGRNHKSLHDVYLYIDTNPNQGKLPDILWTENETRDADHSHPYSKDAFHRYLVHGERDAVNPERKGTKMAAHYELEVEGGKEAIVKLRLTNSAIFNEKLSPFGEFFDIIFKDRIREADEYYNGLLHKNLSQQEVIISRQAYASLLWSKQFYHYDAKKWLNEGETECSRLTSCNSSPDWAHLINNDIISMPDKWEYPWYAAWDLAFHMIPFAKVDPDFAKKQLSLLLGEKYLSPSGQIPASEMNLSAVHPPVHAWAVLQVYKMTTGKGDQQSLTQFLTPCFDKLRRNFDWWANHEDTEGKTVFSGGFLGLNDIGFIDQSKPLPSGGKIEQAEGLVWMAFFSAVMLEISLELATTNVNPQTYEDVALKFLDHFVSLCDTINSVGGKDNGFWNEEEGFYYNHIRFSDESQTLHVRSMIGLVPLLASLVMEDAHVQKLPGFKKRLTELLQSRPDLANQTSLPDGNKRYHLCAVSPEDNRLASVLKYLLNEEEFLSPYGIRSLSKIHESHPVQLSVEGQAFDISYTPGESRDKRFGGNVNWRGPIWLCVNFLLTEALERYYFYYGEDLKVECPTGSGNKMNLLQVSQELCHRIVNLFAPDKDGRRPCHGDDPRYSSDPHWKDLVLFYEYFNGDSGKGCGASHKTGWTALIARYIDKVSKNIPQN